MAMLAKQGWRMLNSPDSLCAKVLKAKYFPTTSILEAKPMAGMPYSWRSILKGVQLMKEGIIWRVGDGANINMWTDPWLARDDARTPIMPRGRCVLTKVQELIDPITSQWDEQMVRENLWPFDAETILETPIREDFEDFLAWHYDSKGLFSVKSAYHLGVKHIAQMIPESSNAASQGLKWEKIWSLTCQLKIKQFIRRIAHNSLPVKRNVAQIGIECDTLCVCCKRLDEDGAHLFLKCSEVTKVWEELGLERIHQCMCQSRDAKEFVKQIVNLGEKDSTLVCCLLWNW
jgi:hypothetical protein